jgi:uncharacterized protein YciW
MDENSAIFILIMTGMILFGYLTAMWIKYRRPVPALKDNEAGRQIETLRQENDRLHERLAVLERIATDPAERTAHAIEQLR